MRSVAAGCAAALLAVAASGCGSGNHARRDAVNLYFDHVNTAERPLRRNAVVVENALAGFSTTKPTAAEERALAQANDLFRQTRARVARLHPPPDARRIHADILGLLALQTRVSGELVSMLRFTPRYARALAPVAATGAKLTSDVRSAKSWNTLHDAFAAYRTSLDGVLSRLRLLSPPPTLRPGYVAEERALARSVALCSRTEAALAKHDARASSAAIQALADLGTGKSARAVTQQEQAAALAYSARVAQIAKLSAAIENERERLVKSVG